ncbi:DNA ligase 1 isoform X2 [Linepithema humile]|uniref:DNA ligase 1 isoform X2 n=1 Tax=Linepithema humile TaxID=83485 RepID=UPI000623564F|nr:PREDICTED: zinc finger CCCH domain-containing protein 13-like isoform X1 [Linepithema humile]
MSYGYNKYSSTMSSRGRGFSSRGGGSYRGRGGGGGNDWSSSSVGGNISRGGYSSSRGGRFKYSTTSYDSRSKYNSGGSERYSSRGGRGEHSNSYKRPRYFSQDSYSARDDHRSSSESTRKRIRSDSYQGGGSGSGSQRYSSYGGSSASAPYDDNKGSSSSAVYEDKRQSERASSYHRSEDRHSASRNYAPPPPPRISEMAPPPTQRYTSSRGRISHQSSNYRGRISTRGSSGRGGAFHRVSSRSDVIVARKRALHSLDYRRKLLGSRSRDYIQRMRLTTTKLRRSGTTRLPGSKKDSGSGTSVKDKDREMAKVINAEFSDDDDEEDDNKSNWDDEEKPHEGDEEEELEEEEKKKEDKRKKEKQDRERQHTEDEEEKDEDIKEDDDQKQEEDEDDEGDDEERDENEKAERERTAGSEELPSRRDGRKFIKLKCPHCAHHSVTFKEYSLHLFSGRHSAAMKRIAARHKATLTRMRVVQRQEQRRIEARDAARGTLPSRTMFCAICKLNYRSLKSAHQLSESHRQMKRFLTPFCRVCRIQFRSPMFFETHMCSLEHIKRKSILRERMNANGSGEAEADSSAAEEDDKEVNLDNFMTLDSVGDVDEDEESNDKKKEKAEGESSNEEKKSKSKQMIKVGAEYIKRVEAQYCELCKIYLTRNESTEKAIAAHCSTRSHLKRYVRDNDDKALRRQAERIHLQSSSSSTSVNPTSATASNTLEVAKTSPVNSEPQVSANITSVVTLDNNGVCDVEYIKIEEEKSSNVESEKNLKDGKSNQGDEDDDDDYRAHGGDKRTWDDVDKDLGDILRESEAGASKSSDDEDSRYDRFRNSDKKQPGKEKENEKNEILDDKSGNKIKDAKIKIEKIDI